MIKIGDNAKNIYIKKNQNKFSQIFGIKQTKLAKPGEKKFYRRTKGDAIKHYTYLTDGLVWLVDLSVLILIGGKKEYSTNDI